MKSVYITDISAWCKIDFGYFSSNPLFYGGNLYLSDNLVTELEIPDDVTEIKPYAFNGCSSISEITIPDHVTSIGKDAFDGCDALTTVEIGNGVISIDYAAFSDCVALTTVKLGNGVTSIETYAFDGCSIKTCYCYALTPPSLNRYTFGYDDVGGETLYVPARKGSAYKTSDWGRYFTNIIEMD